MPRNLAVFFQAQSYDTANVLKEILTAPKGKGNYMNMTSHIIPNGTRQNAFLRLMLTTSVSHPSKSSKIQKNMSNKNGVNQSQLVHLEKHVYDYDKSIIQVFYP